MNKLRYGLAVNIAWFFLFYNIERINEPINIASFVYAMLPVTVGLLAIFPVLHRKQPFALFMLAQFIIYLVLKSNFGYGIVGDTLPITIIEVIAITVSSLLFRYFMSNVFEFEDLLQQLTFRQLGIPPKLVTSLEAEELYREVKRSRRFGNPLVFSIIEPNLQGKSLEETQLMKDLQAMMLARFSQARLANIVSSILRDSDLMVQYGAGFALVLPETVSDDGEKLINQIRTQVRDELGLELKVGSAAFPTNAVTLNGLIEHAKNNGGYTSDSTDSTEPSRVEVEKQASTPASASSSTFAGTTGANSNATSQQNGNPSATLSKMSPPVSASQTIAQPEMK